MEKIQQIGIKQNLTNDVKPLENRNTDGLGNIFDEYNTQNNINGEFFLTPDINFNANETISIDEAYAEKDAAQQVADSTREQIKSVLRGEYPNAELNQEQRIYDRYYNNLLVAFDLETENISDEQLSQIQPLIDSLLENIESCNKVYDVINDIMDIKNDMAVVQNQIDSEKKELEKVNLRYSSMPQDRVQDREEFPHDSTMRGQVKLSRKDVTKDIEKREASIDGLETELADLQEILNEKIAEFTEAQSNHNPQAMQNERENIINQLKPLMAGDDAKIAMFAVNRHLAALSEIKDTMLPKMLEELTVSEEYAEQKRTEIDETEFDYEAEKENLFKEALRQKLLDSNPESVFLPRIDFIVDIANKYGIEPELFAALMCNESRWGNDEKCKENNRYGGIKGSDHEFRSFDTVEEGIEAVAKNLVSYIEDYSTVDEISIYELKDIGAIWDPGSEDWLHDTEEIYCGLKWG